MLDYDGVQLLFKTLTLKKLSPGSYQLLQNLMGAYRRSLGQEIANRMLAHFLIELYLKLIPQTVKRTSLLTNSNEYPGKGLETKTLGHLHINQDMPKLKLYYISLQTRACSYVSFDNH